MDETHTSFPRLLGTALLILLLVGIGAVIGATLWPRVVTVEQRVTAPIRRDIGAQGFAERLPDLVEATCPAIVQVNGLLPTPSVANLPKGHKAKRAMPPPPPITNGFFVSDDGYVLAMAPGAHPQGPISVQMPDGSNAEAELRASDPATGLVLLKVDGKGLTTLDFSDEDFPRIGASGLIPFVAPGQRCAIQTGIVAADYLVDHAHNAGTIRATPALDPVLVGAPLIDSDGDVFGIAMPADGKRGTPYLPGNVAARVVSQMLRSGSPTRALGIVPDDLTPVLARRLATDRQRGAVISWVVPGSAADKAGLHAADIVLAVNGAPISGASELSRTLDGARGTIPLTILRDGQQIAMTLSGPDQ
ncbi:S1C family serine protease [Sphingomonas vulcanisoli]|nr:PDZ domain-containing protein [Sphingomonas vulcanisoli]